ncbi:MAG TPA: chloride channel protein [Solirubrobacteraceae bacterium]|jgi:H+/Cl- antiporter ClcA|nr:chloride channel protein [Solirubrobacteraceae bacterium]
MADPSSEQVSSTIASKAFVALLAIAAVVGVVVSLAAWSFLELVYQIQQGVFVHLPSDLGYHNGPPLWWSLPVLAVAGVVVALAIARLPGRGGHIPAEGLAVGGGPAQPIELPGIMLAGFATIGLGVVLGPEAPLIALGSGLAVATIGLARRDVPPQALVLVAAAGSFAALSFIFTSPLIAAVILIEAIGLGGPKLTLVLLPGLLAAGIGTLVSIGMGSWTGLSTSSYALGSLSLPSFARPDIAEFGWTVALAIAIAVVTVAVIRGGRVTEHVVARRLLMLLPLIGLIVGGLAIAFSEASGKGVNEVLFSGQSALPGLVAGAGTWSVSALALLIAFKGVAYALSLGSFRGGPTFPALFLGAAAGIMAGHLPGFSITPGVAVGMGAAFVTVLRLPLSAVVVATVLTSKAGAGVEPLIIVGVVVAYVVATLLSDRRTAVARGADAASDAPAAVVAPRSATR